MRRSSIFFLTCLLGLVSLFSPAATAAQPASIGLQDDGPYVIWHGNQAQVLRVHQGVVQREALGPLQPLQLEGQPALTLTPGPRPAQDCIFPLPERIAAFSDVHGNYPALVALLQKHHILDSQRHWSFGKGHLVVVGDTFDRGAGVTEALWLYRALEVQARKVGGQLHVLLGNHEVMALMGDLRYLNPKYQALPGLLGQSIPALYGPDTEQGRWLRSLNAMLRLGDILFVHGGPSPALAAQALPLEQVNHQFRQALDQGGKPSLLGRDGPVWYRGLIPGASPQDEASDGQISEILKAFHSRILVIGHTTLDQVTVFHGGRVFGIDAGLKDGKAGELWLWEGGRSYRGMADGRRVPLP